MVKFHVNAILFRTAINPRIFIMPTVIKEALKKPITPIRSKYTKTNPRETISDMFIKDSKRKVVFLNSQRNTDIENEKSILPITIKIFVKYNSKEVALLKTFEMTVSFNENITSPYNAPINNKKASIVPVKDLMSFLYSG